MAVTGYIEIRAEKCKGCGLCIAACNRNLIAAANGEVNALGYSAVEFADAEGACRACKLCAEMCPDCCITVYRARKEKGGADEDE